LDGGSACRMAFIPTQGNWVEEDMAI
jgi:hypothetical protein